MKRQQTINLNHPENFRSPSTMVGPAAHGSESTGLKTANLTEMKSSLLKTN